MQRSYLLCHAAAVQNNLLAGLHCCIYLCIFNTKACCVSTSPQQACLGKILPALSCCCCAKQPYSWTALLRLHICRLPFTQNHVESAPAHNKHAWERSYLLCHAAAVQNSLIAGLHFCVYIYADCFSHRGMLSQHQPTTSMPGKDLTCSVMLLLCKTAL